jgi:hypothetical protein
MITARWLPAVIRMIRNFRFFLLTFVTRRDFQVIQWLLGKHGVWIVGLRRLLSDAAGLRRHWPVSLTFAESARRESFFFLPQIRSLHRRPSKDQ